MRNTKVQSTTQNAEAQDLIKRFGAQLYAERYAEAQDLLKRIAAKLDEHKQRQAAVPADWGWAGELSRINEQLNYVLAELGDASAVRAKGIA